MVDASAAVNGFSKYIPQAVKNVVPRAEKAFTGLNAGADSFIAVSKGAASPMKNAGFIMKNAGKGPLKYFGQFAGKLEAGALKAANSVGTKLAGASWFSKLATKVPFLGKLANGLKGATKLPGIGSIIAAGTAVWGIGKAAVRAFQGDFRGAGHQLLKSAGSVGGILAGVALMATGVGFLPGLALAVGAGFAGDWAGKKVADTVFGKYDEEKAAAAQGAQASADQGLTGDLSFLGGTDQQFNAQLADIMKGSRAF